MKSLRPLGFLALLIGGGLFFLNYSMAEDGGVYFPKLFRASIFLLCVGVTFLLFIGKPLTEEQQKDKDNHYKHYWNNAPLVHKIGWVVGILGGFILSQNSELFMPA